jgi:hypothetical protein
MANVYQQAAKRRKVGYLGAIVALLVLSLLVRGTFFRIGKASAEAISADPIESLTLDGRAKVHELTELHQGGEELSGAAVRLLLTGSRGLAVTALWNSAIEKQKKQEWSELDIAVDSIAKLQPHTIEPWLFQSWNLTYNVSVEMDRLNDMYFYIARGISIAAEGEGMNRNNPDLRYTLGFFYQNKFGVSDRVTTLRCLYQLSCIPEEDRDPDRLLNPDKTINMEKFEQFCRDHRELIRRMKEARISGDGTSDKQVLAATPGQVISFLRNNRKIPSRYKPGSKELEKDNRLRQFPVLPDLEGQPVPTSELNFKAEFADPEQDAFMAARAWYSLANSALPPPNPVPNQNGSLNPDPLKYRVPKRPATIIFRQGPMRAQSYIAERLTKEGWFDNRDPWLVDDDLEEGQAWIPKKGSDGKRVAVAIPTWDGYSAQDAWKEASLRWRMHGTANGLQLGAAALQTYITKAEEFCRTRPGLEIGGVPPALTPDERRDEHMMDIHAAYEALTAFISNRHMTNYETFELEADAMQSDDALLAKKRFRQAAKAAGPEGKYSEAVRLYDEGFAAWQRVLLAHQDCRIRRAADPSRANQSCRDFRDLDRPADDVYEVNMRYVGLLQDVRKAQLREATQLLDDLVRHGGAAGGGNPFQFACDLTVLAADVERTVADGPARTETRVPQLKLVSPMPLPGPLDGMAPDGTPWISSDVKRRIKERLGLVKSQAPPPDRSGPPPGASGPVPSGTMDIRPGQ